MHLSAGTRLGPYEILEPLGEGGMGQVWKARDTRLNRFVAIKTSHRSFNERFEREAHAIAALNHPHVCSLYDVGPDYLVMEYVDGKMLHGPVPLDEARMLAGQILDALDAAHRQGIIHRDLKPGNILLGKNGIKVLDFGLAKITHAPTPDGATETMPLTGEGSILGTLQYMSPEQVEGQDADARSDIFAFGLVFYELISGTRAFTGKSHAGLAASILKEQPRSLRELQPQTPPELERVIQTCLEKDPEKRWQSAREVKHAMEWMAQTPSTSAPVLLQTPVRRSSISRWLYPALAVVAVLAVGVLAWMLWSKPQPPAQVSLFDVAVPDNVIFSEYVSVSPDGRKLVFNTTGEHSVLWIRDLDALQWRQLAGTENAVSPTWSPDNKYLVFGVRGELKKISVAGGAAQTICQVPFPVGTAAWNRNGTIIFGNRGNPFPLWKVSQSGGVATAITSLDPSKGENWHALPAFLPDGKHFIYQRNGTPEVRGTYAGSLDVKPEEQSNERILAGQTAAFYVNGYLFFMRENTLMAQTFDADKLKLTGEPMPVAENVGISRATGVFSVSPSGTLAYRATASPAGTHQLTWFDRQGQTSGIFGQSSEDSTIRISPDGTHAVVLNGVSPYDLWTLDFARGVRSRFTFRQTNAMFNGIWSADGSRIVFAAGAGTEDTIYDKAASGAGDEKELLKEPGVRHAATSLSRDGRFLLYFAGSVPKNSQKKIVPDMWILPLQGDSKPVLLLHSDFPQVDAVFSPDMRWIAYTSYESGRAEIYVRPFVSSGPSDLPSFGEGKWQVSKDGGSGAKWRADGKEIIFQAPPDGTSKMAVEVKEAGAALEIGIPQRLFTAPIDYGWDVTPDGKRFLLSLAYQPKGDAQAPITVMLNWPALLKK